MVADECRAQLRKNGTKLSGSDYQTEPILDTKELRYHAEPQRINKSSFGIIASAAQWRSCTDKLVASKLRAW